MMRDKNMLRVGAWNRAAVANETETPIAWQNA